MVENGVVIYEGEIIQIDNNEMLMSIVGEFDQNLKHLEKLTSTNVFFRGNSITCKGKEPNLKEFSEAIKFLADKYLLTHLIEKGDIVNCFFPSHL